MGAANIEMRVIVAGVLTADEIHADSVEQGLPGALNGELNLAAACSCTSGGGDDVAQASRRVARRGQLRRCDRERFDCSDEHACGPPRGSRADGSSHAVVAGRRDE